MVIPELFGPTRRFWGRGHSGFELGLNSGLGLLCHRALRVKDASGSKTVAINPPAAFVLYSVACTPETKYFRTQ